MKHITLVIGLLVFGCGKQEKAVTNESTPTTNTNEVDGTTEKPIKELTAEEKKVVGTYEMKEGEDILKLVLLENGIWESYEKSKKDGDGKWVISKEGEMHITDEDGTGVLRINKNGSLTAIAEIIRNKREDIPKEEQVTIKKIK